MGLREQSIFLASIWKFAIENKLKNGNPRVQTCRSAKHSPASWEHQAVHSSEALPCSLSQWKWSVYHVETNCADPQADKTKQVNWWNKYAFNSTGKMKVSSVSAPGNNLIWFSALSATPAYTIVHLCSKYCGRVRAGKCVRCCTNIS